MQADEKACPRCAETIKDKAVACRFCGHQIGAPIAPMPAPKSRKRWPLIVGVIFGLFLLLNLAMCMARAPGTASAPGNAPDGAVTAEPPIHVTAMELWRAYDRNEAAAQAKYGEHSLLVDGTIKSIDLDILDNPQVVLRTGNEFQSAQAALADASKLKAPQLKKGQKISLLCTSVSEIVGTPMLKDCEIQ